ncbi:hypothetical protein Tco_0921095 [Tanacetum coccineum]
MGVCNSRRRLRTQDVSATEVGTKENTVAGSRPASSRAAYPVNIKIGSKRAEVVVWAGGLMRWDLKWAVVGQVEEVSQDGPQVMVKQAVGLMWLLWCWAEH